MNGYCHFKELSIQWNVSMTKKLTNLQILDGVHNLLLDRPLELGHHEVGVGRVLKAVPGS